MPEVLASLLLRNKHGDDSSLLHFIEKIVGAFLTDETALASGVLFSKIVLSTSFLFGIYYVLVNALQAMGKAGASLLVNISRQGLVCIPALFILEVFFAEEGILLAQPVADVMSLILTVVLYLRCSRNLFDKDEKAE